jgi:hypothetical protein
MKHSIQRSIKMHELRNADLRKRLAKMRADFEEKITVDLFFQLKRRKDAARLIEAGSENLHGKEDRSFRKH